jgi:transcriptional regulator with XRE-family HTH domain
MSRTVDFDEVLAGESQKVRAAIRKRGAEIVEQHTLRRLREAAGLSQAALAKKTGLTQNRLSRIERGDDVRLSTLSRAIGGLGGELQLVARLAGQDIPFSVSAKGEIQPAPKRREGRKAPARARSAR